MLMARGPYRIPNVRIRGNAVYTNKLRAGSFRGFGNPQATFAGESQIDELAASASDRSGRAAPEERDARRRPMDRRPYHDHLPAHKLPYRGARGAEEGARPARAETRQQARHRRSSALTHISGLMGTSAPACTAHRRHVAVEYRLRRSRPGLRHGDGAARRGRAEYSDRARHLCCAGHRCLAL